MGLILDSSVVIGAERRGETVVRLIERVVNTSGDQESALSAVGLTELVHGFTEPTLLRYACFANRFSMNSSLI